MTEEFDFRQSRNRAENFLNISSEEGLFCNICGEPRSYVETTEAIGFGLYRKVWLCEDCDVAPPGYPV